MQTTTKKARPFDLPVPVGRRRVVGERAAARPPGQKGLLARAFHESRCTGPAARHLCTTQPRSSAASATAASASSARRTCASPRRRGRRSLEIGRRGRCYPSSRLIVHLSFSGGRLGGARRAAKGAAPRFALVACGVREFTSGAHRRNAQQPSRDTKYGSYANAGARRTLSRSGSSTCTDCNRPA